MKSISLILVVFFVFSLSAFAQDTSFAVSSNGNVGIGTPEPTERLHVVGNTFITSSDFINQNGSVQISLGDIHNYIKTTYGGYTDLAGYNGLRFLIEGAVPTEKMRITTNGNVGIGTTTPAMMLDVRGDITTGTLHLLPQDGGNEGGEIYLSGASTYNWWRMDVFQNDLRFFSNTPNNNKVQIFNNDGTGKTDLIVEGEIQRFQTGDANMVPIAYANVNSDGTIRTAASTSNVTLNSHTAGSGNYYFTITDYNVSYLTTVCAATLIGSDGGEINWSSSGGGATLYICTRSSTGTAQDKSFTFVVYKK